MAMATVAMTPSKFPTLVDNEMGGGTQRSVFTLLVSCGIILKVFIENKVGFVVFVDVILKLGISERQGQ